jgi:Cro/C1-type HTH DNA-binding domain
MSYSAHFEHRWLPVSKMASTPCSSSSRSATSTPRPPRSTPRCPRTTRLVSCATPSTGSKPRLDRKGKTNEAKPRLPLATAGGDGCPRSLEDLGPGTVARRTRRDAFSGPDLPAGGPNPQRLSLPTLAALCDILSCTPYDLIETFVVVGRKARPAPAGSVADLAAVGRPRRARVQSR